MHQYPEIKYIFYQVKPSSTELLCYINKQQKTDLYTK